MPLFRTCPHGQPGHLRNSHTNLNHLFGGRGNALCGFVQETTAMLNITSMPSQHRPSSHFGSPFYETLLIFLKNTRGYSAYFYITQIGLFIIFILDQVL